MPSPQQLAEAAAGTRLLVLFGSRARQAEHPHSDWDFAYLAQAQTDEELVRERLMAILGTDRIDLVDLDRASALLRFRISAEGKPVHESAPGVFQQFQIEAATFWCDIEPVLRRTYARILADLVARAEVV